MAHIYHQRRRRCRQTVFGPSGGNLIGLAVVGPNGTVAPQARANLDKIPLEDFRVAFNVSQFPQHSQTHARLFRCFT